MSIRIDYEKGAPEGYKALGRVYAYIRQSGLGDVLVELVFLRISQINGCGGSISSQVRGAGRGRSLHWGLG